MSFAVAVECGAQVIVTSNLRDFPPESLLEWDIEAQHPFTSPRLNLRRQLPFCRSRSVNVGYC